MDTRVALTDAHTDVWHLIDSKTATFTEVAGDADAVADAWCAVHSEACTDVRRSVHDVSVVLLRQVCLAVVLIHAWLDKHDMLESAWNDRMGASDEALSEIAVKKVHALSRNQHRKARTIHLKNTLWSFAMHSTRTDAGSHRGNGNASSGAGVHPSLSGDHRDHRTASVADRGGRQQ